LLHDRVLGAILIVVLFPEVADVDVAVLVAATVDIAGVQSHVATALAKSVVCLRDGGLLLCVCKSWICLVELLKTRYRRKQKKLDDFHFEGSNYLNY